MQINLVPAWHGYAGDDATAIVNTLLYAEMRGNNQGITKIATDSVPKAAKINIKTIDSDLPLT